MTTDKTALYDDGIFKKSNPFLVYYCAWTTKKIDALDKVKGPFNQGFKGSVRTTIERTLGGIHKMIDRFSYHCGVIDCFNEMVCSGVKALALSRPFDTPEERDVLLPFVTESCREYGTKFYIEDAPLLSDLFPTALNRDKYGILLYREDHILDEYLRLKGQKASLTAAGAYFGGNRTQIAKQFGRLLSYSDEGVRRLLAENTDKE